MDTPRKEVLVTAARGGKPPGFGGEGLPPHEEVVAEMRRVWQDLAVPCFLDGRPGARPEAATGLLAEGREAFDRLGLRGRGLARHEDQLVLFPWTGTRAQLAPVPTRRRCLRSPPTCWPGCPRAGRSRCMRELVLGLQCDGPTWPETAMGACSDVGSAVVGPRGFLEAVETATGLLGPEVNPVRRIAAM